MILGIAIDMRYELHRICEPPISYSQAENYFCSYHHTQKKEDELEMLEIGRDVWTTISKVSVCWGTENRSPVLVVTFSSTPITKISLNPICSIR